LKIWESWHEQTVSATEFAVLAAVVNSSGKGLSGSSLVNASRVTNAVDVFQQLQDRAPFDQWLISPGAPNTMAPADRASHYRLRWVRMGMIDSMFESQSGFSTTGATVLSELEDPFLVPHCILFWRSSTHFLGGLGIIVLFVVILGQGSAGKALMRTEVPGPTHESTSAKMQHSAWLFAGMYLALNAILTIVLYFLGMNLFDSFCHARYASKAIEAPLP